MNECDDCQYGFRRENLKGFMRPVCSRSSSIDYDCFVPSGCLEIWQEERL